MNKLTAKELTKLKTKLALEGVGAKGRLADELGIYGTQVSLLLNTGSYPGRIEDKLKSYIN